MSMNSVQTPTEAVVRKPVIQDPLNLVPRALMKLHSVWLSSFYPFASKGNGLSIHYGSQISRKHAPKISLGSKVVVQKDAWLNVPCDDLDGDPTILIDDNCCISTGAIISAKNGIHLEPYVMLGQGALLQDHNHAYENVNLPIAKQGITNGGRIEIGYGAFIGKGASIICSNGLLTIGRGSVIAAHSVVLSSIPPYSVAFGVPARVIRQFDPLKGAWVLGNATLNSTLTEQLTC